MRKEVDMSHSEHKATTTLAFIAGKETREQLKAQAQEARTKAKQKLDEERDMIKDKADHVKAKARKLASEGKHVAEDVARDIKSRADERAAETA
jgi:gas vesicle protein